MTDISNSTAPAFSVFVATYQHKHGSDCQIFASAVGAELWRQEIAAEYWDGLMNEEPLPNSAEMADLYFQRSEEIGDEFFTVVESTVEGGTPPAAPSCALVVALSAFVAMPDNPDRDASAMTNMRISFGELRAVQAALAASPAAPAPESPMAAAAQDLFTACRAIVFQVEQGKVLERDACITQARAAVAKANGARTPDAPAPEPAAVKVWTLTTDGDNMGIETKAYACEADAISAACEGLRSSTKPLLADLDGLTSDALSELWAEAFDGACIIESHEIAAQPTPVTPSVSHHVVVVLDGGLCQAVVSENPDFVGLSYTVIDYDTEGSDRAELSEVLQDDGTYSDACIGSGMIGLMTVKIPTDADYERAVLAAGWRHGGDNSGFWYDGNEFESWKAAASADEAATYGTPKEVSDAEGLDPLEPVTPAAI
jgi:hypothetical protein